MLRAIARYDLPVETFVRLIDALCLAFHAVTWIGLPLLVFPAADVLMFYALRSICVGIGLFVILAIALQNIPEGTATALPMQAAGYSRSKQFWAAVLTSVPQPFGAVGAYVLVDQITGLLPVSFAFAAGAMLALVFFDLVPACFTRSGWRQASVGAAAGGALMVALSALLGV